MDKKIFKAEEKQRLDLFLMQKLEGLTRSHIKTLIDGGKVLVDGKTTKAGFMLKPESEIEVTFEEPKPLEAKPQDIDFDILFEDDDLVVLNKPQGLVVHPSETTKDGTLVNGLLFKIKNLSGINGMLRPGIVHRLDKDTSGVMLVAKNDFAHNNLAKQIAEKSCQRKYVALVQGNVKKDFGNLTTYISRSKKDRKKMDVSKGTEGKLAISDFKVLKRFGDFTLMEWTLHTGRTHQIRVHAKHMGHPVACDETYGKSPQLGHSGQLLHSKEICFVHPTTKQTMKFEAPLPTYFEEILKKLESKTSKK